MRWTLLAPLRGVRIPGAIFQMIEEPQPAVSSPAQIHFPWERVVVLMLMVLSFAIFVMAADMLGYLPTPA